MNDVLVSVLIPSRDRSIELAASIDSLRALATCPTAIEFVVRCDDDDEATRELVRTLDAHGLSGPRLEGYSSLHIFYADCASRARGKWLLLWNDDATMLTKGWDYVVASLGRDTWIAKFNERDTDENEQCSPPIFPIFRREYYDTLGHISLHPCNDSWIHETLGMAGVGTAYFPNIKVRQPSKGENKTACLKAEMYYRHPIYERAREQDALQLKAAYEHWLDWTR